ncbi:MAG: DUF2075 domain-containing protein [Nitrosopumilaceae archaeon]|nr:DUF2075 domain-containing protein [Nitrosopumilaceae archaeon]
MRAYYSSNVDVFRQTGADAIIGTLASSSGPNVTQQKEAWKEEIDILKEEMAALGAGHIFLEFTIPRMGKRADAILVFSGTIFVMEFKVGEGTYRTADKEQCEDYALDMRNFHEGSHGVPVAPILVATDAPPYDNDYGMHADGFIKTVQVGRDGLGKAIVEIARKYGRIAPFDVNKWEASKYKPTPTIIEAARALYAGHSVEDITRSESGAENLTKTTGTVRSIIDESRRLGRKSICFVTGVPGSGKTLAGLNLTSKNQDQTRAKHAVFLSGNGPLIHVLQEALAQDRVSTNKLKRRQDPSRPKVTKKCALRETRVLIQSIGDFLAEGIKNQSAPHERIVVFDEAQRAWDHKEMDRFMTKKQAEARGISQPEFLIEVMERHSGWAAIVCLVGGGQEINHNEAGLPEWFSAVRRRHADWDVYLSENITDDEYVQGSSVEGMLGGLGVNYRPELHLATSIRSFRSGLVSKFVKSVLDLDSGSAKRALERMDGYEVVLTRDFVRAKEWLKERAHGSERYGIVAAAKSYRLKPYGIYVELAIDAAHWFLKPPSDPRSSCSLEYAATEFKIQGLELDWACVAWDADFRHIGERWQYKEFRGDKWTNIAKDHKMKYLKNAYRVLLTRARQGMVIFVPEGDPDDDTRKSGFYDGTYCYLKDMGIRLLPPHAKHI